MKSETLIRVILADDHAVVRAGIRQFLEAAGDIKVVDEVGDGSSAIASIQRLEPDVAVLDIQMPEKSGIEVTRWVRAEAPATGVLILTAYDDDPYILAVLQAGANGYVLKTADSADIVQAVRSVHEGKSALDPEIARKVMAQVSGRNLGSPVERLTDRELEVLSLAAKGYTNKAIGVQLGISDRTVQGHLAKSFNKLQASSRTEAVMRAVSLGWLDSDLGQLPEE
ncbi:MAG: response regulator transcription factor [Anaerolineae bacterium]|nr:MAG: response regulator transcription factor [Anaerolineae bacterium]